MNDRIRLAEAMGWSKRDPDGNVWWSAPPAKYPEIYCFDTDELPDPFTDANDDYAVLEWMREKWKPLQNGWPSANDTDDQLRWFWFKSELSGLDGESKYNGMTDYQIGDYARASLKVLP